MGNQTLESAEEAFREWRMHRRSSVESIPENLWAMAIGLFPQYKRSAICQKLRLSGSQLKQRIEGAVSRLTDSGFVLASRDEVESNSKPIPVVQLTIQGEVRSLTLCVDVNNLNQVLPHLGALL
jgi:hypothetical protein